MEIINTPINDLKEADYNPRQMTTKQVDDLTASIKEFGLVDPIIVNIHPSRKNIIVGGHQRLKIARSLGFKDVPAVYVNLTIENEKRLNLRLNRNNGEWNWDTLANNFDVEELLEVGFDKKDLNFFDLEEDEFDHKKDVESIEQPKVTTGEVYILGDHRILCGDSTKKEDWEKLMQGEKARLIFTDPPYSVNYKSSAGNSYSLGKYGGEKIFNDDKTNEEALVFYIDVLKNLYDFSRDDACIYWWLAFNLRGMVNMMAFGETNWKISQMLIWVKESMVFSLGQDYHRLHEPCFFGWKNGQKHFSNRKYSNYKDVFSLEREDFSQLQDVWYENRDKTSDYIHPTQKPIRLAERALKKNSEHGDVVIDAFGGSGSTLMGCEQSGRKARIIELDPKFCQAIINRWCKYTNKDAVRESDGVLWSEILK